MTSTTLDHLFFLLLLSVAFIFLDHTTAVETANPLVISLTLSRPQPIFPPTPPDNITRISNNKYSPKTETSEMPLKETPLGYTMSLLLGTPLQLIQNIYFDTGSNLVWVPCNMAKFVCLDCDEYRIDSSSFFRPTSSSSMTRVNCSSRFCLSLHTSVDYYDMCAIARCPLSFLVSGNKTCDSFPCPPFAYTYGDGVAAGILAIDTLGVSADNNKYPNISFGCVDVTFKEPSGIAGFGRGALSLPSQLGFANKSFSHCFLPFQYSGNPNISTPLILGDRPDSDHDDHLQFTSMLNNPRTDADLYYIALEAITVGNLAAIEAPGNLKEFDPSGNGGMMIDSGTTYTHLPEPFYSYFLSKIESLIKYPRDKYMENETGFDLCYRIPTTTNKNNNNNNTGLPSITLHFSNNVSLTLPQGTCFYKMAPPEDSAQTHCLLFRRMDNGGPAGIFGSFQQQNVEVVYDLKNERIGFQATDCVSQAKSHGLQKT